MTGPDTGHERRCPLAPGPSRRRALNILAGAMLAGGAGLAPGRAPAGRSTVHEWRGTALGADARILIAGRDSGEADMMVARVLGEVERLEAAFSLYREDSELVRLNRDGQLAAPSKDMRLLLERAIGYWERTGGAFNPAIQPLWRHLATHFAEAPGHAPDPAATARAIALCNPAMIGIAPGLIRVAPGMALTFNGIAQGYITDRVAGFLGEEGAEDTLIGLGEMRALPGRAWRVGIAGAGKDIELTGRAVATSAGAGTAFTADGQWHHLIDPASGQPGRRFSSVTVTAESAMEADALSTALAASARLDPWGVARDFAGTRAIAVVAGGGVIDTAART